jgi:hypothetical protein
MIPMSAEDVLEFKVQELMTLPAKESGAVFDVEPKQRINDLVQVHGDTGVINVFFVEQLLKVLSDRLFRNKLMGEQVKRLTRHRDSCISLYGIVFSILF